MRTLRRSPAFAAIAVASLGLGLGLTTTAFALLDTITHPVAGYEHEARVFRLRWWFDRRQAALSEEWLQGRIAERVPALDGMTLVSSDLVLVGSQFSDRREYVARVEPTFFSLMGITLPVGRPFNAGEEDVAVISQAMWKRGWRDQPLDSITIAVDGRPYRVIGIMPPGTLYPANHSVWLPHRPGMRSDRRTMLRAEKIVRLDRGAGRTTLDAQLNQLATQLNAEYGLQEAPFSFQVTVLHDGESRFDKLQVAMTAAAIAVLLIACVNLANLVLARGLARRGELAVRLAIGASPAAVVRLLLAESIVISVAGVLVGLVLGKWGADILAAMLPADMEWIGLVAPVMSWRVFAASVLAASLGAVVFGLVPAVRIVRGVSLQDPLKRQAGTHTARRRGYSALVTAQSGLCLVLVMGTTVLLREAFALASVEYNFAARSLERAVIAVPRSETWSPGEMTARADRLQAQLLSQPGVRDVTMQASATLPRPVVLAERDGDSVRTVTVLSVRHAMPNYLRTMGRRVIEGRDFDAADSGVTIINASAARLLYPGRSAVGRTVRLGGERGPVVPVVGVVEDLTARFRRADPETNPEIIIVMKQPPGRGLEVLINAEGSDPELRYALNGVFRESGWRLTTGLAHYLEMERFAAGLYGFLARAFGALTLLAVALAAVGIYGVFSCLVADRERDFAIRIGLGAVPMDVARLIGREVLLTVLAGTAIGGTVALGAMWLLDDVLANTSPTDVGSLLFAELVVALVAVVSAAAPVMRAMRVDPARMLRS